MQAHNVKSMSLGSPTNTIQIPALKYRSGQRIWYAATIPYQTLGKFIQTSAVKKKNQQIIQKDIKNRFLDKNHKEGIKNYIKEEKEFTLPPITLVSYEKLDFRPYQFEGQQVNEQEILEGGGSVAGIIVLPIDYEFECLDGNHRTAAIRDLANESADNIAESSMLLNIVHEDRPKKIRQDFVDVNKNAKQTTSSINTLFNTRDPISSIVVDLTEEIEYLNNTTERLSTNVSKLSKDIYTINNLKNAVIEMAGFNSQASSTQKVKDFFSDEDHSKLIKEHGKMFFEKLKVNAAIAEALRNPEKTPEIRNQYVITTGTGMVIASRIAGYIFSHYDHSSEQERELDRLFSYDWSRANKLFWGRVISNDKILNSRESIASTVANLKHDFGYELEENEYKYLNNNY
ncbi:DNA sulfur modification protein DndB [Marinococcus sp. PL1-022]|uniref:DNA sulfur modification protein DndB n=1 Tax=Marinococcus sp. PL1-022 TaxID=3095363 RepID=UPI0029C1B6BA|nr:DNA sulfur modification protein DndB [Marinococcus sp. PL1-022]MDX6154481.1 DNA sulfur modification protein DndB [Marinococcus sp. PL1-022]